MPERGHDPLIESQHIRSGQFIIVMDNNSDCYIAKLQCPEHGSTWAELVRPKMKHSDASDLVRLWNSELPDA
jgi:hypothetical protein